jgi:hypothetical protein
MDDDGKHGGIVVDFEDLQLGMYLVDVELGMPYVPPCGLVVTGKTDDGFTARDDRCHNVYGYSKDDLKSMRLYTDQHGSRLPKSFKGDVEWSVGYVNYCLFYDSR